MRGESNGSMFPTLRRHYGKRREERRRADPDAFDRVVWKYAGARTRKRIFGALNVRQLYHDGARNWRATEGRVKNRWPSRSEHN